MGQLLSTRNTANGDDARGDNRDAALRRDPAGAVGRDTLAVVVPDAAVKFAERVPVDVRHTLNVYIYGICETGEVLHIGPDADPTA